jgi:hypothetical protein
MSGYVEKTWTFLKENASIALSVIVVVVAMISMSTCGDRSIETRLDAMAIAHTEEIRRLTEATEEERRRHDENMRRLREDLDQVARRHDEAIAALEKKKTQQVDALVRKYEDDPVGVAKQISAITGFQVVMP